MPEIGLFPLELVLLPTERVPLHIFEPRYKELIGECLTEGREFGLVLEDAEGRREIGTRARVIEVLQVFDDGRMNVVVEGAALRLTGFSLRSAAIKFRLARGLSFTESRIHPPLVSGITRIGANPWCCAA